MSATNNEVLNNATDRMETLERLALQLAEEIGLDRSAAFRRRLTADTRTNPDINSRHNLGFNMEVLRENGTRSGEMVLDGLQIAADEGWLLDHSFLERSLLLPENLYRMARNREREPAAWMKRNIEARLTRIEAHWKQMPSIPAIVLIYHHLRLGGAEAAARFQCDLRGAGKKEPEMAGAKPGAVFPVLEQFEETTTMEKVRDFLAPKKRRQGTVQATLPMSEDPVVFQPGQRGPVSPTLERNGRAEVGPIPPEIYTRDELPMIDPPTHAEIGRVANALTRASRDRNFPPQTGTPVASFTYPRVTETTGVAAFAGDDSNLTTNVEPPF